MACFLRCVLLLLCINGPDAWASYNGAWTKASIQDTKLTWNSGEQTIISMASPNSFGMDFHGRHYIANLADDGKLHWSDGDVWERLPATPAPSTPVIVATTSAAVAMKRVATGVDARVANHPMIKICVKFVETTGCASYTCPTTEVPSDSVAYDCCCRSYKEVNALRLMTTTHRIESSLYQAAGEKTVTFQPGSIGVTFRSGLVLTVLPGGQAHQQGIKVGWTLLAVGNQRCSSFDDPVFQDARNGQASYTATFLTEASTTTTPQATTSTLDPIAAVLGAMPPVAASSSSSKDEPATLAPGSMPLSLSSAALSSAVAPAPAPPSQVSLQGSLLKSSSSGSAPAPSPTPTPSLATPAPAQPASTEAVAPLLSFGAGAGLVGAHAASLGNIGKPAEEFSVEDFNGARAATARSVPLLRSFVIVGACFFVAAGVAYAGFRHSCRRSRQLSVDDAPATPVQGRNSEDIPLLILPMPEVRSELSC